MAETGIDELEPGMFVVHGGMCFETAAQLLDDGSILFDDSGDVAIDLARVTESDIAGLAVLIEWISQARRQSRNFRLRNIPDQLLAIARISEVDGLLRETSKDQASPGVS